MLYCFLDTNVFLQYQTFDEIDWLTFLSEKEVTLVVPMKVIQELDKHKNHSQSRRLRDRSRMIQRKIANYQDELNGAVRANTTLIIQDDTPDADWLRARGYDPDDGDDCIVGAAQKFLERLGNDDRVILVAEDYGARLKAKANGVPDLEPPQDKRLTDEPDPLEREVTQLRKELLRIQNAQPKLAMKFKTDATEYSDHLELEVDFSKTPLSDAEITAAKQAKFDELKYDGETVNGDDNTITIRVTGTDSSQIVPTQQKVDRYHENLNIYVVDYADYLVQERAFNQQRRTIFPVQFKVENTGGAPARNIDVSVCLPDGSEILSKLPELPELPSPPLKPDSYGQANSLDDLAFEFSVDDLFDQLDQTYSSMSLRAMSIHRTNGYVVGKWVWDSLKHNTALEWDPIYLRFEEFTSPTKKFDVTYSITADNLPDVVTGKLVLLLHRL